MRFQTRNVDLKYLQNYINKLEPLLSAKKKDRKFLLKNKKLINYVCQGVYNILNGQIPINKETQQKLIRFRSKLHALCSNDHSSEQKIKILNQTGGFIQALLPSIITGVLGLVSSLVERPRN